MRIVVVGGGKVGGYLAREFRQARHAVVVIEADPERARVVGEETGALTLVGDGTDVGILEEADVARAGFFLAVTGHDEDNLVACQLARTAFGCTKLLARVNDPRNGATFEALGVPAVSVTDLLVQVISRELDLQELVRVALLERGQLSLIEVEIPDSVPPRSLREISLHASTVLVALRREGELLVPDATTVIEPGDRVLAVTQLHLEDELRNALSRSHHDRGSEGGTRHHRPAQ